MFVWLIIFLLLGMAFFLRTHGLNLSGQIKKRHVLRSVLAIVIVGLVFYTVVDKTHLSRIRADIVFKQADKANKSGNPHGGIALYQEALRLQEGVARYHLNYAYALQNSARNYSRSGNKASNNRRYASDQLILAEQTLLEARANHPLNVEITSALGDIYLAQADNAESELKNKYHTLSFDAYELAINLSPLNFRNHNAKAHWYVKTGQWEQAEIIYLDSVTLNPTAIVTRLSLAGVYMQSKNYDGVIQVLSNIRKFGNKAQNNELKVNKQLALAYAARGRLALDDNVQRSPNQFSAQRRGDMNKALEIQRRVLEMEEYKMGALLELGTLSRELNQYDDAKNYLETALLLSPDKFCNNYKKLYIDLAEIYRQSSTMSDVLQTQSTSTTNQNDFTVAIIELNAAYTIDDNQTMADRLENCVLAIPD
jgi:predicted Zn-dependent protease